MATRALALLGAVGLAVPALAALAPAPNPNDNFFLHLFNESIPTYPEAVCLDGSAAGFYLYNGSDTSTWVIELEGGGWCVGLDDCAGRAKGDIGSSLGWPREGVPGMDGGSNGALGSNCTTNFWCNATKVHLNYCDGASFAGNVSAPVNASGQLLYFRGAPIFVAAMEQALALGMAGAQQIVLKGCSAGGLATYLHCDWLADWLRARGVAARLTCMPDAGFFRDHPTFAGGQLYTPQMQWVFGAQGVASGITDADCLAHYAAVNASETWRCFMAEYVLPFITTPIFPTQDLVDSWQLDNVLQLGCKPYLPGNCSAAQLAAVQAYRTSMIGALAPLLSSRTNGGFFSSCIQHCHQNIDAAWDSELVDGQSTQQSVQSWWTGSNSAQRIVVDGPYGTNTHCFAVPYEARCAGA